MLMRLCLAQASFDPGFNELSPPQPGAWPPGPGESAPSHGRCCWEGEAAQGFGLSAGHGSQTVIGIPGAVTMGAQGEEAGCTPTMRGSATHLFTRSFNQHTSVE